MAAAPAKIEYTGTDVQFPREANFEVGDHFHIDGEHLIQRTNKKGIFDSVVGSIVKTLNSLAKIAFFSIIAMFFFFSKTPLFSIPFFLMAAYNFGEYTIWADRMKSGTTFAAIGVR